MNSRKRSRTNAVPFRSADRILSPVQHRIGNLAVVHDDRNTACDTDDQSNTQADRVPRRRMQSVSPCSPSPPTMPMTIAKRMNDEVISGNHHQRVGTLIPMSVQGMTPYIIMRNAEKEEGEHNLLLARSRGRIQSRNRLRCMNCASLAFFWSNTRELRWIGADLRGVPPDPEDADRQSDDQDDESARESIGDRNAGKAGCDAGRERIDRSIR